jgi:hypothetical protein
MEVARNLNELLKCAPRSRLGFTDEGDSEELLTQLDDPTLIGASEKLRHQSQAEVAWFTRNLAFDHGFVRLAAPLVLGKSNEIAVEAIYMGEH